MDGRKLAGIGLAVLVIGVAMHTKFSRRSEAHEQTYEAIMSWVQELPCYQLHPDTMGEVCQRAHDQAFNDAYDVGARYRGARFDDAAYLKGFFEYLIKDAERRKDQDAVRQLKDCQSRCEQMLATVEE